MRVFAYFAIALGLSACGNFCVGPIGDVENCYGTQSSSSSGTGTLRINYPSTYISGSGITAGTTVTLTATGGAGNYRWQIFGNANGWTITNGSGTSPTGKFVTGNTVIFHASSTTGQAATIQLLDGNFQETTSTLFSN